MMSMYYSKFGVDTFNTFFEKSATLKILHDDDNDDDLPFTIAELFLRNRQAKNIFGLVNFFLSNQKLQNQSVL